MSDNNSFFNSEDDSEEPEIWDEFKWEEFMKESDRKTETYVRLLKKYRDHPDRKKIIAKEMGWTRISDELENEDDSELNKWNDFLRGEYEEGEDWKQKTGYEVGDPEMGMDSFQNLPVYQKAFEYTIDAMDMIENRLSEKDDESIDLFAKSVIVPPAKIAGGFGLGFDLRSLGGNIANCKRGLVAANQMLDALRQMNKKNLIDDKTYLTFHERAKEVRDELAIWIVELRERFRNGIP